MNRRILLVGVSALLLLVACESPDAVDNEIRVVATTSVLGDIVSQVVGDEATVEVLLPRSADPHDFQLSPQQVASLSTADLVVANGLGLEEGSAAVLEGARSDGVEILEVGPFAEPQNFGGEGVCELDEEDGDHEAEHAEHGDCDPHFWLDPRRIGLVARKIANELESLRPGDWTARAEQYASELDARDAAIATLLESIPEERRLLVTNHDALGYFASRYGFEIIGTVIPGGGTLGDPSSEALAELVRLIREHDVPAIFVETNEPAALAETVAAEVGDRVEVVALFTGTLGEPGQDGDNLLDMLLINAERIANALR